LFSLQRIGYICHTSELRGKSSYIEVE
jgi:hypothetical protein